MKKLILLLMMGSFLSCSTSYEDENTSTAEITGSQKLVNPKNGTIIVGTQKWMVKNLNVSNYRNGDVIPQVTDATEWASLTTGAWCYYDNDPANGSVYGKIYNWYAVNDPRGLAPNGYHIPTYTEWTTLIDYLGGAIIAAGAMKETGIAHWNSPNIATNSSGLTFLGGGFRYDYGLFAFKGAYCDWWVSPEANASETRLFYMVNSSDNIYNTTVPNNNTHGLYVRCIKN